MIICPVDLNFRRWLRNLLEGWKIRSIRISLVCLQETVWNSEEPSQSEEL
jgi:hypothetical protein